MDNLNREGNLCKAERDAFPRKGDRTIFVMSGKGWIEKVIKRSR